MSIKAQLLGGNSLKKKLKIIREYMSNDLEKALFKAGKVTEITAIKSILEGGKSGETYKRRTVTHRASAPGEAPASDTGRLVNSIRTETKQSGKEVIVRAGGTVARYAGMLEFGTSKMEERPFMRPAAEKGRQSLRDDLKGLMRKATDVARNR